MDAALVELVDDLIDWVSCDVHIMWDHRLHEPIEVAHLRWICSLKMLQLIKPQLVCLRHRRPWLQSIGFESGHAIPFRVIIGLTLNLVMVLILASALSAGLQTHLLPVVLCIQAILQRRLGEFIFIQFILGHISIAFFPPLRLAAHSCIVCLGAGNRGLFPHFLVEARLGGAGELRHVLSLGIWSAGTALVGLVVASSCLWEMVWCYSFESQFAFGGVTAIFLLNLKLLFYVKSLMGRLKIKLSRPFKRRKIQRANPKLTAIHLLAEITRFFISMRKSPALRILHIRLQRVLFPKTTNTFNH